MSSVPVLLQVTSVVFSLGGLALTIITWIQAVATAQHCRISRTGIVIWSTGRLSTLGRETTGVLDWKAVSRPGISF